MRMVNLLARHFFTLEKGCYGRNLCSGIQLGTASMKKTTKTTTTTAVAVRFAMKSFILC